MYLSFFWYQITFWIVFEIFCGQNRENTLNFSNDVHNMPDIKSPTVKSRMTCFDLATADEVRKVIINSPSKTCDLDPIPTELLKSCLDVLLVNLSFISKIIEKVIADRIRSHLQINDLSNQSAYKKFHSTETALLKVENEYGRGKGHCTYPVRSVCCFRHSGPQQYDQYLVNLVWYRWYRPWLVCVLLVRS